MELGASAEQTLPLLAKALLRLGRYQDVLDLPVPQAGLTSMVLAAIQAEKANAFMGMNNFPKAALTIEQGEAVLAALGNNTFSNDLQLARARLAILKQQPDQAMGILDTALQRDANFIDALYMKAQLLIAEGKTADSLKTYERIITVKPSDVPAYIAISDIKLRNRDFAGAEKALSDAEIIAAKNVLVKFARAKLSNAKGDLKKANELLQHVLRVAPDYLPALLLDAAVNYGLGNFEQSLKSAQKILAQIPGHLNASKLAAASKLQRGEAEAALAILQPLERSHAEDIELLSLLGEAHLQIKQYDKAMALLDRAATLQPQNPVIKQIQARGHLARGRTDLAELDMELAAKLNQNSEQADVFLITLQLNRKEYNKALQAIADMEKKFPNNPIIGNLRGLAYLGKNDHVAARKAFESSLAIQPDFIAAAVNLARLDLEGKRIGQARQRFTAILEKDGKNIHAMMALAELAASEKKEREYLDWLEKAIKTHPGMIPPRASLVRYHLGNKEINRAMSIAQEAVNHNPGNADALNLLAATQLAAGEFNQAIATFSSVAQKSPSNPDVYYRQGIALSAVKRYKDAKVSLNKAVELRSDHLAALDALIKIDIAEKNTESALRRARELQQKAPTSPIGYEREANILLNQKKYSQAAKIYEQTVKQGAGSAVLIKWHRSLYLAGERNAAEQKLSKWLKDTPEDNVLRAYAAEFYQQLGRNRESIALYESILLAIPNNITALNNLALLYLHEGDKRSLGLAEKAYQLAPKNPGIQDTLGWILVQQNKPEKGLALLKEAIKTAPDVASLRYHYAVALARTGNKADAKRELENLVALRNPFPELNDAKVLLASLQ